MQDPYVVLGVERTASQQDIKKAYRRLAMEHHPDRNVSDPAAEEKFKSVSEAYSILKDETSRREYDSSFIKQQRTNRGFGDLFSDLNQHNSSWEEMFGTARSRFNSKPYIINAQLDVTLEEIFRSERKMFVLDGQTIEFKLPATSRPGQVIPIRVSNGQELHITIGLVPHNLFSLHGDDLHYIIDIPIKTAIAGGRVVVPTLAGDIGLKVPAYTSSHTKLRVRDSGLRLPSGGSSSTIYEVRVDVSGISDELKDLILAT
jgi:curved DNA-binding protein|tara:strand:+ start:294 stop:1070 length:777 start_codon:yes stop_codon:yes gene_type:complete